MNDLTQGPIRGHLARLSGTILFGMVFQTLYYLVDLYFVAQVGSAAVAAVGLSGNLMMVTIALTQALTIGTTTLVAQAWGRKDFDEAHRVFNQSQVLATAVGLTYVVVAFLLRGRFAAALAADAETAALVHDYLDWFLPSMGVQFLLVAMGAALRGAGEVKAPMFVQVFSVVANIVLAPILIVGWGTGRPMGVAGAGLATFLAMVLGSLLLVFLLRRRHDVLRFQPQHWWPDWKLWRKMLAIGLPTGGEFFLMSIYATLIYALIRDFGAGAQAGFGVGGRVMQTFFMPALALAFALAPIAGQNYGAGAYDRVRQTFKEGLIGTLGLMLVIVAICHFAPELVVRPFSSDPQVIAVSSEMLRILSFNFLASGVVFVCGSLFQAFGNTMPSLLASMSRILCFALPSIWVSRQPGFELTDLWWISVGSVLIQMSLCLMFLRREMRRRIPADIAV